MGERRIDSGRIFKSEITPEGFLRVWMTVSRAGKLRYRNHDGSIRTEIVEPKELFRSDSLDTAWGKPVTIHHPKERINIDNARDLMRGMTQQGIVINDNFLTIAAVFTDREAIDAINNGLDKVSAGYDVDIVERSDELYQTNRIYEHFALTNRPRGGDELEVHHTYHQDTFRCDAVLESDRDAIFNPSQQKNMVDKRQIRLDSGISYDVDSDLAGEISKLQSDRDTQKQRADEAEKQRDRFEGELSGVKSELQSLQDSRQDEEAIASEMKLRLDTWAEVLPSFPEGFQPDYKLNSTQIKQKYLEEVRGRTDLKNRSDEYIDAVYSVYSLHLDSDAKRKTTQHLDSLNNQSCESPQENPLESAREKVRKDTEAAYRGTN
ncbi:MAG: DUF2213 domain-containing protein [Cyanobacteria bacterium SBLK]|nr:DUF2213 domain-containing protein [Cyanobacteria bacterium SBLK]